MDILENNFNNAINIVNNLTKRPNDDELLEIYGFFKQAKFGDNNNNKPLFFNFKQIKKWKAWNKCKNLKRDDSKQKYIDLAIKLYNKYKE